MSTTANLFTDGAYDWMSKPHQCSICEKEFTGWGNNPEPLRPYKERCCDQCNNDIVIQWRMNYGRNFEPRWIPYGLGKTECGRMLCLHPIHEERYRINPDYKEPIGYTEPDNRKVWSLPHHVDNIRYPINPNPDYKPLPDKIVGSHTFPGDRPRKDAIDEAIDSLLGGR